MSNNIKETLNNKIQNQPEKKDEEEKEEEEVGNRGKEKGSNNKKDPKEEFTLKDIPRCINCSLICSLKLNYTGNFEPRISYECENGHSGNISLEEYINKYNKLSLLKEVCSKCEKPNDEELYYCSVCKKFICLSCVVHHKGDKHSIINIRRYDSLCTEHSIFFSYYCAKCRKNLCIYCLKNHKSHELINLTENYFSKKSRLNLNEVINHIEKRIDELDTIEENIKKEIKKLKDSTKLELQLLKILLKSYEYEEKKRNLNYNIIQNLKNFDKTFRANKIQFYERLHKDGSNLLNILKNLKNINTSFPNNFQTLKNHTSQVYHISKLSDGRLISCSSDNSVNIYKKDSYELETSIKEYKSSVYFISELKDRRIISCEDKTMKIIKLLDDGKYQIDQELIGHKNYVYKAIEIKDNVLISISYDKTMKIWKLNKEKKFENILTSIFQKNNSYCNILKISKKEFVTSSCSDYCIKFWNSNTFFNLATIENISTEWTYNNMCLLDNDILCVAGTSSKGFYLININSHQLIKTIIGPKTIYSITKCIDGLYLCSIVDENSNNSIVKYEYDYEKKNLNKIVEKKNAHKEYIYSCVELNKRIIASGSKDYTIQLWEI